MEQAGIIIKGKLTAEADWIEHIDELKLKIEKKKLDFKHEFVEAVRNRIPKQKFGILFSGGIDSTLIAFVCKTLNADFVCYTVGLENSPDIISATEVAKKYGFNLKTKVLSADEFEQTINSVVKIVGPDTLAVGVGSVVYEAVKLAEKDNIHVFFSGLGSEEIFAGYERHEGAKDVNEECWNGLRTMHARDFTRDVVVAKALKADVRVPFLDENVIVSAMQIPGNEKIKEGHKKYILRKFAEELGLADAWRKKQAAQYGSYFDKTIEKIAKKHGFKSKTDYLHSLFNIGALVSGGKDSIYALYLMQKQHFNVKCMLTMRSKNPDSYMFHSAGIDMVKLQAESAEIPLLEHETKGEKEKELDDLQFALADAKKKYNLNGIVTGALFSDYQRARIENICSELGLKAYSPLWHMDQEKELREIIDAGFEFILTKVACDGLDKLWLNKVITHKDVDKLVELNKKIGINIAFEGGEAESLVISAPIFKKRIVITDSEIKTDGIVAELIIKNAKLV
jgi:diphthine-ammonia ligase